MVRLSLSLLPLSEATTRSGAARLGTVVSTSTVSSVPVRVLPAGSVKRTAIVWSPSASVEAVSWIVVPSSPPLIVWVAMTASPLLVSISSTVSPTSRPVAGMATPNVGVLSLVRSSLSLSPESDAATRSGAAGTSAISVSMEKTSVTVVSGRLSPVKLRALVISTSISDRSILASVTEKVKV